MEEAHWLLTASTWMMHMKLRSHFMELALVAGGGTAGEAEKCAGVFHWETVSDTSTDVVPL